MLQVLRMPKQITIPQEELFNEDTGEFIEFPATTITIEHSLISISKWESKWKKPLLKTNLSKEEFDDYVRCMTLTQNTNEEIYRHIPPLVEFQIRQYMEDTMTATWFSEKDPSAPRGDREIITSELIYYWMVALNIPFECQKWHINRLLTLIRICSIKNQPDKKIKGSELAKRNRALNAARRMKHHTKG